MVISMRFATRSFTLVELVVVIAVILILLGLVLPAASAIWQHSQVLNVDKRVINILRMARTRSLMLKHSSYGILVHIDPSFGSPLITYIRSKTTPDPTLGETFQDWQDVCDRYEVDTEVDFNQEFLARVGFSPLGIIEWEIADILNEDYRAGKQRNFFAIVFRRGQREMSSPIIIYDEDADDDGFGDQLSLSVGDVVGEFGGKLNDVLIDADDKLLELDLGWDIAIYDRELFKLLAPTQGFDVPFTSLMITETDIVRQTHNTIGG